MRVPKVPNIGPLEVRKRRILGIVVIAFTIAVYSMMLMVGVGRWWRLVLFPLMWLGALGLFQAWEET